MGTVRQPAPTEEELERWDREFAEWQPRTISAWVEMARRGRRLIGALRDSQAEVHDLREAGSRANDRLWHSRWMKAHDHDRCSGAEVPDDECREGYERWVASQ